MKKIAFIFPGQGAQVMGMGQEIIEHDEDSRSIFDRANNILDFDLQEICFSNNDKLHTTAYTQPALLTVSIAILKTIEKLNIKPDYVAGLSLGEYTALVANGAMNFEDAVMLVRKRGILMEEASNNNNGSMAAVMGSDEATINKVLRQVEGVVEIANYNSHKQIVIAGESDALKEACIKLEELNIRVIPINVSGAFHTDLMMDAANKLEAYSKKINYNDFHIPYVTNVTGEIAINKDEISDLLVKQVTSSVKWVQCISTMIDQGVETFVEIGPSNVLAGLMKKIDRSKKVFSVSDLKSLNMLKEYRGF